MNNDNFLEQLQRSLNNNLELPLQVKRTFLTDEPSIALFPVPGGGVTTEYWDGTKDMDYMWQLMVQVNSAEQAATAMWAIYGYLANDELEVNSSDGSYIFNSMQVQQPTLEGEKNEMIVWSISGTAKLTIENTEE